MPLGPAPTPGVITLQHCSLVLEPWGCVTHFRDRTSFGAHPHDTHHYHVIAHRLGYGDDVLAYAREHEFCHSFAQERLHDRPSPIVWALAHGGALPAQMAVEEEVLTMTLQRWLRAAERPIVGGVDWDGWKRDALGHLVAAGWASQ